MPIPSQPRIDEHGISLPDPTCAYLTPGDTHLPGPQKPLQRARLTEVTVSQGLFKPDHHMIRCEWIDEHGQVQPKKWWFHLTREGCCLGLCNKPELQRRMVSEKKLRTEKVKRTLATLELDEKEDLESIMERIAAAVIDRDPTCPCSAFVEQVAQDLQMNPELYQQFQQAGGSPIPQLVEGDYDYVDKDSDSA
eukprot:TRINITY_DN17879_c0_g1_i1.p1 TRINITY_DN17879_c0_g1~~TRINITY_DN17879_c0_g1_i1.p1  ORF type:complete len:193 (+),score=6.41 TRINITY_DN17879_c0_g1_i1:64-642(+)